MVYCNVFGTQCRFNFLGTRTTVLLRCFQDRRGRERYGRRFSFVKFDKLYTARGAACSGTTEQSLSPKINMKCRSTISHRHHWQPSPRPENTMKLWPLYPLQKRPGAAPETMSRGRNFRKTSSFIDIFSASKNPKSKP